MTDPQQYVADLPAEQLPALAAALFARLLVPTPAPTEPVRPSWALSAADAAARLGKTRRWLFEHAAELPFVRRVSRKTLVCDESLLESWIARRPR